MTLSPEAQFIIGPQVPIGDNYFDQTFLAEARQHGLACPSAPPANETDLNSFVLLHYYDLALVLYIAYQRTGDPDFLALARNAADSWWQHPQWIGSGTIRQFPDSATPAPRHAGIGGLILRALDGRPEMWDWINAYVRAAFDTWIKNRQNGSQLHYGLREGAFVLQFAAWLAKALPDSFPNAAAIRAQYLADIESACVNYFGRLQLPDGSWRWDTTSDEPRDNDGGTWVGIMQPFMVGLMTSALIDAHQVVQSATVKTNIENQILKACRHLYSDGPYIKDEIEQNSGKRIRGFHYFYHGGTSVSPTKYAKGDMVFPWTDLEGWWLASARQPISTILPAFGYAYKISGDPFFRDAGDELWDSAYSGRDGIRAMLDDTAKNFNQHGRRVCSYRAWLGSGIVEPPLPPTVPPPQPPEPSEPPTIPSPSDSVPVVTLTSPTNNASLSGRVNVTTTVTDSSGIAEVYLIVNDVTMGAAFVAPYDFNLDTTRLSEGNHSLFVRAWNKLGKAGDSPKITVTVANAQPPAPVEPPTPPEPPPPARTCSISAPTSITVPRNSTGTIAVTLQDVSGPTDVKVLGSDGQVTVTPLLWPAGPTSTVKQFQVRTKNKKQSRTITFQSPCGAAVVNVNVT